MSKELRQLCQLKGGSGFPEKYQGNSEGQIPFIKVSDMNLPGNERYITTANHYVSEVTAKLLNATVFPIQSVVFAKVGAALLLNRRRILNYPTIIDNNMMAAIPFDIDGEFLYHFLCTVDFGNLVQSGALPSVNQNQIGSIRVLDFTRRQQQKIARILQTIDRAIELTEALIDKYQQIKSGLMHDLFTRGIGPDGQLRPPREQAPHLYQKTSIGWIPREWEPMKLKEILHRSGGYLQTGPFGSQLHSYEYTEEGIPVIMPQDIYSGKIDEVQIARITEVRAQSLAKHRLKIGDIIIARRGELSRAAAINETEQGWVCGTGCFLLRLGGANLDARFFSMVYRNVMVQRQVDGLAVGSTMPSLNNEIMGKLVFPYLTMEEQSAISDKVQLTDDQLSSLAMELEKLKKQKSGLMHDLLTGKVPVTPDPEPAHG